MTVVLIAVVAAVALVLRYIGLGLAPLAFQPHRQLTDAAMARGYWAAHLGGQLPSSLPGGYEVWVPRALEPPILQGLGALSYTIVGGEALWLPRALLATAWVVTGFAVWGLVRRLTDRTGGMIAAGLWLFSPYAIVFSRSFLPDVAMLCLIMAALWAMVRDQDAPTRASWALAGCTGAVAILLKPTAVFAIVPAELALAWVADRHRGLWSRRTRWRLAIVLAPAAIYWTVFTVAGRLQDQGDGRVDLATAISPATWRGWIQMAGRVVPVPLLVLSLVGVALAPRRTRVVAGALLCGYVAHTVLFASHAETHDYYHVLVIPPVAIGLASLASMSVRYLQQRGFRHAVALGAVGIVLVAMFAGGPRPYPYVETALPTSLVALPESARASGDFVGHDEPVLLVSRAYGIVEQYYGYLKGPFWPLEADLELEAENGIARIDPAQRLRFLETPSALRQWGVAEGPIEWVVVSEPMILAEQPELEAMLVSDFRVAGSGPGWTAWRRR